MNILHAKYLAGSVLQHNHRICCQYNIRQCWLIHYVTQDYLSVIMLLLWYIYIFTKDADTCGSHCDECTSTSTRMQSRLSRHSIFSHRVELTDPLVRLLHFQAAKLHTLAPSLWYRLRLQTEAYAFFIARTYLVHTQVVRVRARAQWHNAQDVWERERSARRRLSSLMLARDLSLLKSFMSVQS